MKITKLKFTSTFDLGASKKDFMKESIIWGEKMEDTVVHIKYPLSVDTRFLFQKNLGTTTMRKHAFSPFCPIQMEEERLANHLEYFD